MVNIEDEKKEKIEKLVNRYKLSEKEHNNIYQPFVGDIGSDYPHWWIRPHIDGFKAK